MTVAGTIYARMRSEVTEAVREQSPVCRGLDMRAANFEHRWTESSDSTPARSPEHTNSATSLLSTSLINHHQHRSIPNTRSTGAYLRQGTSYQCRDISPDIWRIGSRSARPLTTFRISQQRRIRKTILLYSDGDPDRHQNLVVCSLAHCKPSPKISCKSVRKFLREVANRQTNRPTDKQTNKQTTTKT